MRELADRQMIVRVNPTRNATTSCAYAAVAAPEKPAPVKLLFDQNLAPRPVRTLFELSETRSMSETSD